MEINSIYFSFFCLLVICYYGFYIFRIRNERVGVMVGHVEVFVLYYTLSFMWWCYPNDNLCFSLFLVWVNVEKNWWRFFASHAQLGGIHFIIFVFWSLTKENHKFEIASSRYLTLVSSMWLITTWFTFGVHKKTTEKHNFPTKSKSYQF